MPDKSVKYSSKNDVCDRNAQKPGIEKTKGSQSCTQILRIQHFQAFVAFMNSQHNMISPRTYQCWFLSLNSLETFQASAMRLQHPRDNF